MPTFVVSFIDRSGHSIIEAEYFRHEGGWTTFKDAKHKVVYDLPDSVIKTIRSEPGAEVRELYGPDRGAPA